MDSQHNGTPPQTQTPELYYPLTYREWLQAIRCLKPAERDVLYRRIHLFYNRGKPLKQIEDIQSICADLDVEVTFEEVQEDD